MSNLGSDLLREMKDGYMADTFLVCLDGTKFGVHRYILGARSEVFKKMFQTSMKEKETGIVEIEEFGSDVVGEFREFLYSDLVCENSPNIQDLLKIGHLYQVKLLVDLCGGIISTKVNRDNVIGIANMAEIYDIVDLTDICINLLAVEHLTMDQLNQLTPTLVVKCLSKSTSIHPCEVNFFTGVGDPETVKAGDNLSNYIKLSKNMKLNGVGLRLGEYKGQVEVTVFLGNGNQTVMRMNTDITSDRTTTPTVINLPKPVVLTKDNKYRVSVNFKSEVIRYKSTGYKKDNVVITASGEEVTVKNTRGSTRIPIVYLTDG